MEQKSEQKPAESKVPSLPEDELLQQFAEIATVFREDLERGPVVKQLFALVPELESIQKDVRQKVTPGC